MQAYLFSQKRSKKFSLKKEQTIKHVSNPAGLKASEALLIIFIMLSGCSKKDGVRKNQSRRGRIFPLKRLGKFQPLPER